MLILENSHLYSLHEMQYAGLMPLRLLAHTGRHVMSAPGNPVACTRFGKTVSATCELIERMTRRYGKPDFRLTETTIKGRKVAVEEKVVSEKSFCNLIKFERAGSKDDSKLLIVAPMSGHYATLLRGTVEALLPHYEVYITDWIDAREVPLYEGDFTLDDYIDYVIEFLELLGPDVHVMGVCQPSVPVLAAVSIMSAEKNPKAPRSMIFMGGPIDTRINPTEVNSLAETRPLSWFESHVITRVPVLHPGFMRRVYPGFLQLTGFMTMNLERHIEAHAQLFNHLIEGDEDSVESHTDFYNEYLSVMDLPAEFYLQTIQTVFQEHALPRGIMKSRGRPVRTDAIRRTALLAIEGERDDISGVGQTKAALDICNGLSDDQKQYHLQMKVGHYGIFNGRRYREEVVPVIVDFIDRVERNLPVRNAKNPVTVSSTSEAGEAPVAKKTTCDEDMMSIARYIGKKTVTPSHAVLASPEIAGTSAAIRPTSKKEKVVMATKAKKTTKKTVKKTAKKKTVKKKSKSAAAAKKPAAKKTTKKVAKKPAAKKKKPAAKKSKK